MADINFFKVSSMPTPAVANSVYFVKSGTSTKIYVTDTTGTPVGVNSVDAVVSSVNGLNGNVQLELSLSGGSLSITGGTTPVNLDNRYLKTTDNISWSKIIGQPTTLGGYGITDAYTKSEVTAITGSLSNLNTSTKASLVAAINELNTALADQLDVPSPIDCSTNPNYPASNKGDTYKVTAAGKIGGANGVNVGVGDLIICTANTSGGDQATAGDNFFVVESNVDMATESVAGIGRIATQAEVTAGENATAWVTPATLAGMGYLTSFSETDPIFSASPAGGISSTDITNWNAKVDPGDNVSELVNDAGYLSSETDPVWTAAKNEATTINGDWRFNSDNLSINRALHFAKDGTWTQGIVADFGSTYKGFLGFENFGSLLTGNAVPVDFLTARPDWSLGRSDQGAFAIGITSGGVSIYKAASGQASGSFSDFWGAGELIATQEWVTDQGFTTHDPLTLGTSKNGLSLTDQVLQLALATTNANGAMSSADKTKLNGIATNANNYTLPKASASTLGGIKVGNNLSIDANGVLSASDSTYSAGTGLDLTAGVFDLLPATAAALGGVKIGTRLSITAGGTLSADKQMVWAAPPEW